MIARTGFFSRTRAALLLAVVASGLTTAASARDAELVYADGRRETVAEARKDAQGRWMAMQEGRLTLLTPGEVVVVVDAAGKESETIPTLLETPDPPETAALLASLCDPKNGGWLLTTAPELAKRPTRGIHDALVKLAADKKREMRLRAISMLARLRTKESVTAASAAILAEKDGATRREAASTLFSVEEIFRRCDAAKSVEAGLADKDSGVRYVYAMVSPRDLQAAIPVLRADGLKASDHHVRESAALELGQRGDGSGESLLITLLARDRMPGVTDDRQLEERLLIAEQVAICEVLGKLGSANGKAALQKATASKLEPVRKAAEKALAAGK